MRLLYVVDLDRSVAFPGILVYPALLIIRWKARAIRTDQVTAAAD
jgi:hypothetical protein